MHSRRLGTRNIGELHVEGGVSSEMWEDVPLSQIPSMNSPGEPIQ
jgi:hypothetical protein